MSFGRTGAALYIEIIDMKKQLRDQNIGQRKKTVELPPSSSANGGRGKGVQLYIPHDLYKSLKQAALDRDTTIRAVVLAALKNDGFTVKLEDLKDRRTQGRAE